MILEQLIAIIPVSYISGILVWLFTSILILPKKVNKLPGGAIGSGFLIGFQLSHGNIVGAIVGAVCGLLGHITMVSFSKTQMTS
jgi:hypothetical protein